MFILFYFPFCLAYGYLPFLVSVFCFILWKTGEKVINNHKQEKERKELNYKRKTNKNKFIFCFSFILNLIPFLSSRWLAMAFFLSATASTSKNTKGQNVNERLCFWKERKPWPNLACFEIMSLSNSHDTICHRLLFFFGRQIVCDLEFGSH